MTVPVKGTHLKNNDGESVCVFCKKPLANHARCQRCTALLHRDVGQDYPDAALTSRGNLDHSICDYCATVDPDDRKWAFEIYEDNILNATSKRWKRETKILCYGCKIKEAQLGLKYCVDCTDDDSKYDRYKKVKKLRVCPTCYDRVSDGRVYCLKHRQENYNKTLGRYWDHVRRGVCTWGMCEEKSEEGKRRCQKHADMISARSREQYKKHGKAPAKDVKYCTYANCQNLREPNRRRCKLHMAQQRVWSARNRGRQSYLDHADLNRISSVPVDIDKRPATRPL